MRLTITELELVVSGCGNGLVVDDGTIGRFKIYDEGSKSTVSMCYLGRTVLYDELDSSF